MKKLFSFIFCFALAVSSVFGQDNRRSSVENLSQNRFHVAFIDTIRGFLNDFVYIDDSTIVSRTFIADSAYFDHIWEATNGHGIVFGDSTTFLQDVIFRQQVNGLFYVTAAGGDTVALNPSTNLYVIYYKDGTNYIYTVDSLGNAVLAGDINVNGGDIKTASGDLTITPNGDDVLLDAGLTVGSATQAGDNNLRVEGTSTQVGDASFEGKAVIDDSLRVNGPSLFKSDVTVGTVSEGDNLTVVGTRGAELITGSAAMSLWSGATGWSWVTDHWEHTTGNTGALTSTFNPVAGTLYEITFTISTGTSGAGIQPSLGGYTLPTVTTSNTYTYKAKASTTTALVFTPKSGGTWVGSFTSCSVKTITDGNISSATDVVFYGQSKGPVGSAAYPSHSFFNAPDYGMYYDINNSGLGLATGGTSRFTILSSGVFLPTSTQYYGWRGASTLLYSDANYSLDLRNSTNPNVFNVYNRYDAATNYERAFLRTTASAGEIGTEKGAGGGTARPLNIMTDNTSRIIVSADNKTVQIDSDTLDANNAYFGDDTGTNKGILTVTKNALGETAPTNAQTLALINNTAAVAGGTGDQFSPGLRFRGYAWETTGGTSQPVDWKIYSGPTTGAVGNSYLYFDHAINNGSYSNRFYINGGGGIFVASGSVNLTTTAKGLVGFGGEIPQIILTQNASPYISASFDGGDMDEASGSTTFFKVNPTINMTGTPTTNWTALEVDVTATSDLTSGSKYLQEWKYGADQKGYVTSTGLFSMDSYGQFGSSIFGNGTSVLYYSSTTGGVLKYSINDWYFDNSSWRIGNPTPEDQDNWKYYLSNDYDSDGSVASTGTFSIGNTAASDPANATTDFAMTSGLGYAFDKPLGVNGASVASSRGLAVSGAVYMYRSTALTSVDGYYCIPSGVATAVTTVRISPRVRMTGNGWDTNSSSSKSVSFAQEVIPVSEGPMTAGSQYMQWAFDLNDGGYSSIMRLEGDGKLGIGLNLNPAAALHVYNGGYGVTTSGVMMDADGQSGVYASADNVISIAANNALEASFAATGFSMPTGNSITIGTVQWDAATDSINGAVIAARSIPALSMPANVILETDSIDAKMLKARTVPNLSLQTTVVLDSDSLEGNMVKANDLPVNRIEQLTASKYIQTDANGHIAAVDSLNGAVINARTIPAKMIVTSPAFITPNIGAATGTSLAVSGTISGTTPIHFDKTMAGGTITLTADSCKGHARYHTVAAVVDYTLPAAAAGLVVLIYDIGGAVMTIDPVDGTDTIYLDGTTVGPGDAIDSPGAVGNYIALMAIDDTRWITLGRSGTFVDGGVD